MISAIIAEDDETALRLFAELLEMKEINVVGKARNGNEAVELYKELKPSVVFLDIMMPEYDGFFALESIRMINPESIIIIVTADTSDETSERLERLRPSAIIQKPYEIQSIMSILSEQLKLPLSKR